MDDPLGFIESVPWTFAKTMPWIPHFYIVKGKVDTASFVELVRHIRLHGRLGRWGKSYLHSYLHLPSHDWYYWAMGGTGEIAECSVINRAKVSTDNVRYLDQGNHRPGDREIIDAWCESSECPQCLDTDSTIVQEWAEPDDLFGFNGTRLVSLTCPACGWRYL